MTTATRTAPTADEITRAIKASIDTDPGDLNDGTLRERLRSVIEQAGTPLAFPAGGDYFRGEPGPKADESPWGVLAGEERDDMLHLLDEAVARAARISEVIILEELTAAGVQFTNEHPNAARSVAP